MNSFNSKLTEYAGEWWLPSKPHKKFFGQLTFDSKFGATLRTNDTLLLELLADFGADPSIPTGWKVLDSRGVDFSTVHGHVQNSDVSLAFCHATWFINRREIVAHVALWNIHISNLQEKIFLGVKFRFNNLDKWGHTSEIVKRRNENTGQIEIIYSPSKAKVIQAAGFELQISHHAKISHDPRMPDITLTDVTTLNFTFSQALPLEELIENYLHLMQIFLLIASNDPNPSFDYIVATYMQDNKELIYGEVFIEDIVFVNTQSALAPISSKMLLSLVDIDDEAQTLFSQWFNRDVQIRIRALINSYTYVTTNPAIFGEVSIFSLIQALEAYYKTSSSSVNLTVQPSKKRKVSLKNMLQYLIVNIDSAFPDIVNHFGIASIEEFADEVSKMRNNWAHEAQMQKTTDMQYMYKVNKVLIVIVQLCIFSELHLSNQLVRYAIQNYHRISFD